MLHKQNGTVQVPLLDSVIHVYAIRIEPEIKICVLIVMLLFTASTRTKLGLQLCVFWVNVSVHFCTFDLEDTTFPLRKG